MQFHRAFTALPFVLSGHSRTARFTQAGWKSIPAPRVAIEVQSAVPIAEPWPTFLQIVELEPHERKQDELRHIIRKR